MLIPLDWLREEGDAIGICEIALADLEIRLSMRAHEERQLELYGCLDFEESPELVS
jgi:hypothetical protein